MMFAMPVGYALRQTSRPPILPQMTRLVSTESSGSNDSRLHVVEPPRGRSFIWQIGVNSSIKDRRQVDRVFLWSRVSRTRQR